MIHTDYTKGINPVQVLAETLAQIASMPIDTQKEVARIILNYDASLLVDALLPNLLGEMSEKQRTTVINTLHENETIFKSI